MEANAEKLRPWPRVWMRREGAEGVMEFKTGFGATMKEDFKEVCTKCLEDAIITRRLFNLQLQILKLYEKSPPRG